MKFGPQYTKFLKTRGFGSINGNDIYGVGEKVGKTMSVVTATLALRTDDNVNVPNDMAVIGDVGNGDFWLVDKMDNVHSWYHEMDKVLPEKMKFDDFINRK